MPWGLIPRGLTLVYRLRANAVFKTSPKNSIAAGTTPVEAGLHIFEDVRDHLRDAHASAVDMTGILAGF